MIQGISKPASLRLIKLVDLLEQLESENATVTSSVIEHKTGWSRDTIRRDISLLGVQCGSSSGYNIKVLNSSYKNWK